MLLTKKYALIIQQWRMQLYEWFYYHKHQISNIFRWPPHLLVCVCVGGWICWAVGDWVFIWSNATMGWTHILTDSSVWQWWMLMLWQHPFAMAALGRSLQRQSRAGMFTERCCKQIIMRFCLCPVNPRIPCSRNSLRQYFPKVIKLIAKTDWSQTHVMYKTGAICVPYTDCT